MKKLTSLITACVLFTLISNAQTKRIFHKSHSGSNSNFTSALKNKVFGTQNSNFGDPVLNGKKFSITTADYTLIRVDSVIRKSDTLIILVEKNNNKKDLLGQMSKRKILGDKSFAEITTTDNLLAFIYNTYHYRILTPKDSIKFINILKVKNPVKKKK
jgi:hypothetical protein